MNKKELIGKIKNCFDKVPYPGDDNLTIHPLGFDEEFYIYIKGKTWQELDLEMLKCHHDCIGVLTPDGFQYYLPAFLLADLKEKQGSVISEMLIINLSNCARNENSLIKGVSGNQWLNERLKILSGEQKSILIDFLQYYRNFAIVKETIKDIDTIIEYIENNKNI
jgi:hypothetical protein